MKQLGNILVFAVFIWIAVRFMSRLSSAAGKILEPLGLPGWSTTAVMILGVVILLAVALKLLKGALVNGMPGEFEPLPTTPQAHPWLDQAALERYTSDYESLGFTRLHEFTTKPEGATGMNGFARLWVHPENHCLAEVNQLKTAAGILTPMRSVVMSKLDQDWALSTTDRKPQGESWILRKSRGVWSSHPDATPQELLRTHLERRSELASNLGVQVIPDLSMDSYTQHERKYLKQSRAIMQRRSMVMMLLEILVIFKLAPKYEWWGEYRKVAKKESRCG